MRNLKFRALLYVTICFCVIHLNSHSLRGSNSDLNSVTSFSPLGTVKDIRQVRVAFAKDMVTLGDPRSDSATGPFEIKCQFGETPPSSAQIAEKFWEGQGRWADSKNWVYDFPVDLPAGVQCVFKGKNLRSESVFQFNTGGPAIKRTDPWEGSLVEEAQIFVLNLNGTANRDSIVQNSYFEIEGILEKVPVNLIEDDPRVLKTDGKKTELSKRLKETLKLFLGKFGRPTRQGTRKPHTDEVYLHAKRKFPPGANVKLVWGKGIRTTSGLSTSADQTLPYKVRPEFFAEFRCERENAEANCNPVTAMQVLFNSNVPWKLAKHIRLKSSSSPSSVKEWVPHFTKEEASKLKDEDGINYVIFQGPFPEKSKFQIHLPKNAESEFKDDSGRRLMNVKRFPLEVATAEFSPLIKFPSTFGLIEFSAGKEGGILPVTVRNVENPVLGNVGHLAEQDNIPGQVLKFNPEKFRTLLTWLTRLDVALRDQSLLKSLNLSKDAKPISIPRPTGEKSFEVIGIPFQDPGFYLVEIESPILGSSLLAGGPMYVQTGALITNLSVHLKMGRESSLVWVTKLDSGKPVQNASVNIRDCKGKIYAQGKTDFHGRFLITSDLPVNDTPNCNKEFGYGRYSQGLFATAEWESDFSFVHTSWDKGIENFRFQLPSGYILSPTFSNTVLDRTLFRVGETVHMKHFFRSHSGNGMSLPVSQDFPNQVSLTHAESSQSYELPLQWRNNGVAESTWHIPKGSKLGTYIIQLKKTITDVDLKTSQVEGQPHRLKMKSRHRTFASRRARSSSPQIISWHSGGFEIQEFKVPLMKGVIQTPKHNLINPREIPLLFTLEFLSGGPANNWPVHLRYQKSESGPLVFKEFDGFAFALGRFKKMQSEVELEPDTPEDATRKKTFNLDRLGMGNYIINILETKDDTVKRMNVELEYSDPNGEIQTVSGSTVLYPTSRVIAVKPEGWYGTKEKLDFQIAVSDLKGVAIKNAAVEVEYLEHFVSSHRKRLVGGFYAYENQSEIRRHGKACSGITDEKGLLVCQTKPPISGNIILEAMTLDEGGRKAYSHAQTWVYDSSEWWFAQEDSDRIDVLPERKKYEPGETAVFQVRMPFREATALVSVEREGILDSFIVPLSGKKPLIEIPIKENYTPNVYISTLVVRGRVSDPKPTAIIDLGKPSYKLGVVAIDVGWKHNELKVQVMPSKTVYQVREKGKFKIKVTQGDGSNLPGESEIALAAVDEGLLSLRENLSWNLLENMMARRGYEVNTYTAQTQVTGKRHFGQKALAPGGGGGKGGGNREIFESLLYWNGKVPLNPQGEAEIEFPMNDSLTSFRVVAIAHAGKQHFGTGSTSIRTTQDLMILSGIPTLAREGDFLVMDFTFRNTTLNLMNLVISGNTDSSFLPELKPQDLALPPGEAKKIPWTITVPTGVSNIEYRIGARLKPSETNSEVKIMDQIKVRQQVLPAVPVRVVQATLKQTESQEEFPIQRPSNALNDRGGVRILTDSTLLSSMESVKEYMLQYPYRCLEQDISKAVVLRDKTAWKDLMAELPAYLDPDGLVKYFPVSWLQGSDILTSYLLSISHQAEWKIPMESYERMIRGLTRFVEGQITRISSLPTADLAIRKVAALEALSRFDRCAWKMTTSLEVNLALWPTSAVLDWHALIKRLAHVGDLPNPETRIKESEQILRSRLNFQGTTMGFSTENIDHLWWMMVSTSVNANRLLLQFADQADWREDMGRIAQGSLGRQLNGHWDTTTANAWGTLAIEKFSKLFENIPVTGSTRAKFQGKPDTEITLNKWDNSAASLAPKDLGWPSQQENLMISHSGTGRPWVTLQLRAAIPLGQPVSTGYQIKKSWSPIEQKVSGKWSRGDIGRVKLELEAQSDMTWVVVDDPIPTGTQILGTGLGNDSALAISGQKSGGWAAPAFTEKAKDSFRAYYEYVPKGKWHFEYTVRFNQVGKMLLPPTRVEAMYAPEMFGEIPNEDMSVTP